MSNTKSVNDLLAQYSFTVAVDHVVDDLVCIVCHKLMIEACQGLCGCHYCHQCISDYMRDNQHCPGGKRECKDEPMVLESEVFRNPRHDARIRRLNVHCPHDSCPSIIALDCMANHIRVCIKRPIGCPYSSIGCDNEWAAKEEMMSHLTKDMIPHSELLIELIRSMKNEIDSLRNGVENNKREISYLREESKKTDTQIAKTIEEMAKQRNEFEYFREEFEIQQNRILTLEQQVREIKGALTDDANVVNRDNVNSVGKDNDTWVASVRSRFDDIEKGKLITTNMIMLCPIFKADFIWRVDKFSEKLKTMKDRRIFSDPFYSGDYKLCLYLYIDADNIVLCCMVMRGDYDDTVQWPMKRAVTLSIVDQYTLHTYHSVTLHYDTFYDKTTFDRPTKVMNDCGIGYYYDWFMKYSSIRDKSSIVVDDSIVVSCVISDP